MKTTPPPENNSYGDIMTGTNFSNDMLILHQNGEINSNDYFSRNFRYEIVDHVEWKRHCTINKKMSLSSAIFQISLMWFTMVYQTIISVILHLFIICYGWLCNFPFSKKRSVITGVLFLVGFVSHGCPDVNKSWLSRQHWPFMSIKSFVQSEHRGRWQEMVSLCLPIRFNWHVCWPWPARVPFF